MGLLRRKVIFGSGLLIIVGVSSLAFPRLNLGIESEGGVVWEIPATEGLTDNQIEDVLAGFGQDGRIQKVTGSSDIFRIRAESSDFDEQQLISEALAEAAGIGVNDLSRTEVEPSWGDRVTSEARNALVWFFVLIAAYIVLRYEWKMAVAILHRSRRNRR